MASDAKEEAKDAKQVDRKAGRRLRGGRSRPDEGDAVKAGKARQEKTGEADDAEEAGGRVEEADESGTSEDGEPGAGAVTGRDEARARERRSAGGRDALRREAGRSGAGASDAGQEVIGSKVEEPPDEPEPPFPAQHQRKPGIESKLEPRPRYEAPTYRGSGKLEDRVALITGADSGIGRAVAVLYAREGADVAIHYLCEDRDAQETKAAVEKEGRKAILIRGDLTEKAACVEAVKRTVDELGRLDILVNNAAYQQHEEKLEDLPDDRMERTFRTNIFAFFHLTKAALPHLKPGSAIVNSGSVTAMRGSEKLLDYSATKGAIHAFTQSLALQLVDRGIRVNCVAPGPVWTPLNPSDQPAEEVAGFGKDTPMGRPAQPEEIAPAYVFLAANSDSSFITGEVLPITGGEVVH